MSQKKTLEFDTKKLKTAGCACTNLKMASRVVSRSYDSVVAPFAINSTQYAILVNILRAQPVSQMRLVEHLDLERTTLYRAVDVLEKNGLVKTTQATEGLTKVLELTAKGEKLTIDAEKKWSAAHQAFVKKFGSGKWNEFLEMINEVKDYFREE